METSEKLANLLCAANLYSNQFILLLESADQTVNII